MCGALGRLWSWVAPSVYLVVVASTGIALGADPVRSLEVGAWVAIAAIGRELIAELRALLNG